MWAQNYVAVSVIPAQAITTSTAAPAYVDLAAYADLAKREMKLILAKGAYTTITTATFAIEECDTTNGTYAAPAYGTTSVVSTNTAATVIEMNFTPQKRYVRLPITVNATGSVPVAATLVALKRAAP